MSRVSEGFAFLNLLVNDGEVVCHELVILLVEGRHAELLMCKIRLFAIVGSVAIMGVVSKVFAILQGFSLLMKRVDGVLGTDKALIFYSVTHYNLPWITKSWLLPPPRPVMGWPRY